MFENNGIRVFIRVFCWLNADFRVLKKKKKKNPKRNLIPLYPNRPVHLSSDGVVAMHVFY